MKMSSSKFSKIDEYGFERPDRFDYNMHEEFMSQYIRILAKRSKRWTELKGIDKYRRSNSMKRFVRKGIPGNQRQAAWLAFSGGLALQQETNMSYSSLKTKINDPAIIEMIEIDIPRTFPENIYFSKDDVLPKQLFNILATFAHCNSDVGYCQGLNYIAGLLLLATKSEESSFWILKALIEQILPSYYINTMSGLLVDLAVLDELVLKYEPIVHRHIKAVGMPWAVAATKWFICLYAEVLPTETVLRIWDCIFYEGSKVIFRVALTLIRTHKQEILQTKDLAELVTCFREMGNSFQIVNCHKFISDTFKIPSSFSNKSLEKLRQKHSVAGSSNVK